VNELQELAASIRLAGEQGAKIKESLAAKAASLAGPAAGLPRRRPMPPASAWRCRTSYSSASGLRRLPGPRLDHRRLLMRAVRSVTF
jgi:hypothetical protein